jgi:hypothetical protein
MLNTFVDGSLADLPSSQAAPTNSGSRNSAETAVHAK